MSKKAEGKSEGAGGKKGGKPDPRDNLRTSAQQMAYTQTIAKEQAILNARTKTDIARMEPMLTVNNNYLGMFRKDDPNNNSIKIGTSLQSVDLSKVDPTKVKPKHSVAEI